MKYNNKYYYIPLLFLDENKNLGQPIWCSAEQPTPIYEKAYTTAKDLYTVGTGESVLMCGAHGSYAKVQTADGKYTGYMQAQFLIKDSASLS